MSREHVRTVKDRYGNLRFYFERKGDPRTRLPGSPGEPMFEAAYQAALAGKPFAPPPRKLPPKRIVAPAAPGPLAIPAIKATPGSFSDLVARFYRSERFIRLKRITQETYRNSIERLRVDHGEKPIALLDAKGVRFIVAPYADRPNSRNQMLKMLRGLLDLAVEDEDRPDNPALGIKRIRTASSGYKTWQEEHIRQFLATHGVGSKAYVAIALALYTGQRRSDLVRLNWKMVFGGRLQFTQSKTGQEMDIPIAPRLMSILETYCPKGDPAFLMTQWGNPFTAKGFSGWFRAMADAADLPLGFNSHGLRKAVCRRLAEAGCTTHEIMAISGHKSLAEVERYTSAANRRRLADNAMAVFGVKPAAPPTFEEIAERIALPEPVTKTENSPGLSPWNCSIVALPRELAASNDNSAAGMEVFQHPPVSPRMIPQL